MQNKLLLLLKKDDPSYPYLKHDIYAELTAPLRNKIHNIKTRLAKNHNGIEGYINVKVTRAKRNSKGIPIDKDGLEILDPAEYETRCVYEYDATEIEKHKHNLLTTNGRDWIAGQVLTDAAAGDSEQGANEMALSTDTGGASAAHDALSGNSANEINSGGLDKSQGVATHTDNTNSTAIVGTFTASATHTAVQLAGLFYDPASRTGQLIFENTFTPTTLNSGDILELTWTITIG